MLLGLEAVVLLQWKLLCLCGDFLYGEDFVLPILSGAQSWWLQLEHALSKVL